MFFSVSGVSSYEGSSDGDMYEYDTSALRNIDLSLQETMGYVIGVGRGRGGKVCWGVRRGCYGGGGGVD